MAALDLSAPIATIVADVDKAISVVEEVVGVVQDFKAFLPANIETAILDLQNILNLVAGIVAKV